MSPFDDRLAVAQDDHWIRLSCRHGREVRGQQRGDDNCGTGQGEHHRILRGDVIQHRLERTREKEGAECTGRAAEHRQPKSAAHDQAAHDATICPKRETDTDLTPLTAYVVRHDAEHTDHRQERGQQRKHSRHRGDEALLPYRPGYYLLHRLYACQRQSRVQRTDDLSCGGNERRWIVGRRAYDHRLRIGGALIDCAIELRRRSSGQAEGTNVADDADDFPPLRTIGALAEALANGVLPGPELLTHRLVDEHGSGAFAVTCVEHASTHQRDPERLEVITVVPPVLDQRGVVRAKRRRAFDLHFTVEAETVHGQMTDEADVLNAAHLRQTGVQVVVEGATCSGLDVARTGRRKVECDHVPGRDAGVA